MLTKVWCYCVLKEMSLWTKSIFNPLRTKQHKEKIIYRGETRTFCSVRSVVAVYRKKYVEDWCRLEKSLCWCYRSFKLSTVNIPKTRGLLLPNSSLGWRNRNVGCSLCRRWMGKTEPAQLNAVWCYQCCRCLHQLDANQRSHVPQTAAAWGQESASVLYTNKLQNKACGSPCRSPQTREGWARDRRTSITLRLVQLLFHWNVFDASSFLNAALSTFLRWYWNRFKHFFNNVFFSSYRFSTMWKRHFSPRALNETCSESA